MSGFFVACALLVCAIGTPETISDNLLLERQNGQTIAVREQDLRSVLVELITSDMCGDCEAAEQILAHLDRDQPVPSTKILALSERLDPSTPEGYLSPTDPTKRQEDYQAFGKNTQPPIFLVNGIAQPTHVTEAELEHAIASAPAELAPLTLTSVQVHGRTGSFTLASDPPTTGYVDVYTALVHRSVTSDSQSGTLQTRYGVVEMFGRVGSSFRTKAFGERPFLFQTGSDNNAARPDELRLVVFVQTKHKGAVLGVASCSLRKGGGSSSATLADAPCPGLAN